jgi:subtilisin family serine protease
MLEAIQNNRSSVLNSSDAMTLGSSQALFLEADSGLIQASQHSAVASLDSNLPLIPPLSTSSNQAVEYTEFPLALSESVSLSGVSRRQSSILGSETVGDMESNRSDRLLSGGKSQGKNKDGNSLNKAQRIKLTSQWQMTEDSVGTGDRFDIYRFDLKKSKSFRLKLASQQDSVDVLLLNDAGETVRDLSGPFGKKRVVLNTALDTGTYYLKVTGHDSDTDYQLSLSNEPGGSRRSAQPIGSNEKTWVDTIGLRDKFDLYRFDVDKKSTVRGRLKGLQSNADLALMNSQGQMIQASRRFGKKNESVGATLEKGTYYLKVTGWGEETKYRLNLAMKAEAVPPIPSLRTGAASPGSGVFTVGETGKVSIDYLFDGSESQGELAIFNLAGMEQYGVGSKRYIQEAMLRSLGNSPDSGYVVILDQTEGAKFTASAGEPNFNAGEYRGTKTFTMRSGDKFGVMLVPNGTTPDKLFSADSDDDQRPLFSIPEANPESAIQLAQITDALKDGNSFAFEDISLMSGADLDFDDLVFQVKGATGNSSLLNSVVASGNDWQTSQIGQQVEQFTLDPLDPAGNTIDKARRVNVSTSGKDYRGWVGSSDLDDFYSFSLGARNDFKLSLNSLTADANVELLDITGQIVASSKNSGTASEFINTTLDTGAYRIRVTSAAGIGTAFNLKLAVTPMIPGVEGITTGGSNAPMYAGTDVSSRLIRMDSFRGGNTIQGSRPEFAGIDGRGYSAVVLDSGIDLDHPFFGPDNNRDGIADRIVYNFDFVDDRGVNGANDRNGHGSHVTSILASQNATFTGMAPSVNIIHLKVLPDIGSGSWGDMEHALQWVLGTDPGDSISRIKKYNIASINMSIWDGQNYTTSQSLNSLDDEFAALNTRGVIAIGISGNGFSSAQGIAYPAADPNVLSVSSVWDGGTWWTDPNATPLNLADDVLAPSVADQIAQNSQRDAALTDIFAPGQMIVGAGSDRNPELRVNNTNVQATTNGTLEMGGTSMAAPHIAGMAVLAQQLAQQELGRRLSPREFRDLLYNSGTSINDPITGVTTFRRADMLGLANAIMNLRPQSDRKIDLSASRFDVAQQTLNTGGSLTTNFQVQNTGLDDAASFNVSFYLSEDAFVDEQDIFLNSFSINRIAANNNTGSLSNTLTLPSANDPIWRAFRSNTGHIGMIVDGRNSEGLGANSIGEINENNNRNLGLSIDSDSIQLNQQRQITVFGNIEGVDDETVGSNETGSATKEQKTTLIQPNSQEVLNMNLRWGGEVRVELTVTGQVTDLVGNIQIEGVARLFEETSENNDDLDGEARFSLSVPRGEISSTKLRVANDDEGGDFADISLTFDSTDASQPA